MTGYVSAQTSKVSAISEKVEFERVNSPREGLCTANTFKFSDSLIFNYKTEGVIQHWALIFMVLHPYLSPS